MINSVARPLATNVPQLNAVGDLEHEFINLK